ncbi:MAG: quinone-dependent dihydroorotate dehydrogenase [Neisseriaceae bacterium]|nr:quinone-dependent dihydroorotate dehydrogenase [Neisseriaceae bacterium]
MYHDFIRPLLFKLDAEQAHRLILNALSVSGRFNLFPRTNVRTKPCQLMGLNLPNPVGLAAGLDKNAEAIDGLAAFGFGFIEVGTLTPRPQDGNPKPRLFRLPEYDAIINRMGFNNYGIDAALRHIERAQYRGVLGINIGKNATTPIENAVDDYLIGLEKAYAYASYITINISSPNTKNLRSLQGSDELSRLLGCLKDKQQQLQSIHGKYVPLAVKIAPDLDEAQIADIAHVVRNTQIDGVIATNTTINKTALGTSPLAQEEGGLSGKPVREPSNIVLKQLVRELSDSVDVIGVGGIFSGEDAQEKIQLGAKAVQLYSGFFYRGPELVKECLNVLK